MDDRPRIELHLRCRVASEHRAEFVEFLRQAIPYYQRPGGIRVRLLRDVRDDSRFIELVEYADEETYERDQRRVEQDAEMKSYLARWRALLAEPPEVEVYRRALV